MWYLTKKCVLLEFVPMPAHKRDSGREREDREEKRKGPGESACVCVFVFIRSDKILFSKNVSVSFLALFQAMLRQEHQDGHFFYSTLVLPSCAVFLLLLGVHLSVHCVSSE
jgi:hypothetical protein